MRVWAPSATTVLLDAEGRREPMTRTSGGWWEGRELPPDTDYLYVVDGRPLPDPRSRRQPAGVYGPSRTVAPQPPTTPFRAKPFADSVVYELHVGTFTPEGTFDGAIARLPHLADLGIDVVEVMPVHAFPGRRGWGYDAVGLWAVHEPYGGPAGLRRFVEAAHAHGLAVALDVVYNHVGPGNELARLGPYFTDEHRTPWGPAMSFGDPEVRAFVVENARMWVDEYGVDGLRLDAVHAIHDESPNHVLAGLTAALPEHVFVVAESNQHDPRTVLLRTSGGYQCTAQWCDDLHHALHAALTGETRGYYAGFGSLADVATHLESGFVSPATSLVGYAQTHDQVGNRARGERLGHLVPHLTYAVAALVLTGPYVPMLFMGEEWGASTPWLYFTDHDDPALAEAVREGRRAEFAEFGWTDVPDPQDPATYERSVLDWSEARGDLLDWHRALIALRRNEPVLRDSWYPKVTLDGTVLTVARGDLLVVADLGGGDVPEQAGDVLLAAQSVAILRR